MPAIITEYLKILVATVPAFCALSDMIIITLSQPTIICLLTMISLISFRFLISHILLSLIYFRCNFCSDMFALYSLLIDDMQPIYYSKPHHQSYAIYITMMTSFSYHLFIDMNNISMRHHWQTPSNDARQLRLLIISIFTNMSDLKYYYYGTFTIRSITTWKTDYTTVTPYFILIHYLIQYFTPYFTRHSYWLHMPIDWLLFNALRPIRSNLYFLAIASFQVVNSRVIISNFRDTTILHHLAAAPAISFRIFFPFIISITAPTAKAFIDANDDACSSLLCVRDARLTARPWCRFIAARPLWLTSSGHCYDYRLHQHL